MAGTLIKGGNLDRDITGRKPCEGEDRNQDDASTSQQTPEGRREAWNRFPLTASEETSTAGTLTLDMEPPELRDSALLLSKAPLLVLG